MKAVVLAAGRGQRLSETGPSLPKPLVSLAGKPLVGHTLNALAEAGVERTLVVTGHGERAVRQGAQEWARLPVEFAANPRFHQGASYSLAAARDFCGEESFLLVMCDHAFSPQLLQALLDSAASDPLGDTCRVAADRSPRTDSYVDEATKLATDRTGFVTAIGKSLAEWDALDAGAFVCSPAIWNAVEAAPDDCGLSDIFAVLAQNGRLGTVDISGHFWYDIDTAADLREAERLFAASAAGAASRR
ncbi:MAG: NTP transferase domain-containing protein [Dehalococcoidia bacterium]|nr:NTP transferase domain-containing protein [Dehalococcoidia bacterium]MYD29250.1 NTP transferase domain-containing protein [Dehalococcoidia bacterium]